jgi:hypothetical protein
MLTGRTISSHPPGAQLRGCFPASASDTRNEAECRITAPRYASIEDVKLGNGAWVIGGVAGRVKTSPVNGNIKAEKLESRAGLSTVNWQLAADFDRVGAGHPAQQLNVVHQGGPQIRLTNVNGGISIHSIWSRRTERPTI